LQVNRQEREVDVEKLVSGIPGSIHQIVAYENIVTERSGNPTASAERLLVQGWKLSKYPPVNVCAPIDWTPRLKSDRSHEFHIQCLDMVNALLAGYSHSAETRYLTTAIDVALDWVVHHRQFDGHENNSQFIWYDMSVGMRSYRLAYLYDAAVHAGMLDEETRGLLWSSLEQHAAYLADDANIAFHNNHGYYQVAGQLAMGRRFAGQSPLMKQAQQQGRKRLKRMLEQQFAPDGVHREHSPDYHRMVYDTLKALIDSGLVTDAPTLAFAQRIEEALSWFVYPNQRIVNFGDSDDRTLVRKPREAESKWLTPEMRFWVSGGQVGSAPAGGARAFTEGGYWVARQAGADPGQPAGWSYLALNAAFHSRTHKHADDLSLVWHDRGHNILVDAGRYGYIGKTEQGSELWLDGHWYADPWRVYCESTRAHNTLEFDGRNFPRRGVKPYGSALQRWGEDGASGLMFAEAECKHFGAIRHARLLVFQPGQWLLVLDWFHDNKGAPHTARQWFHVGHALQVAADQAQYVVALPGSTQPLRVAALLGDAQPSRLYLGEEEPQAQGWWSAKERDIVPNYAFCHTLEGVGSGVLATLFCFSERLQPDHDWSKVNASGRKGQLRWMDDAGVHELRFERLAEGELSVDCRLRPR